MDPEVEELSRFATSKSARKRGQNASRDFHRWVHRTGKAFPVPIRRLKVPVRVKRRNKNGKRIVYDKKVDYPVIFLSDWFEAVMRTNPSFFLGGYDLYSEEDSWTSMFAEFWTNFAGVEPNHPVLEKSPEERSRSIPIAIHGDEGRGLAHVPLLVISFQVLIPSSGPNKLNMSQQLVLFFLGLLSLCFLFFLGGDLRVAKLRYLAEAFVHNQTSLYLNAVNVVCKRVFFD